MQQAQILTFGIEGPLAQRLREVAEARRCWLRETSQLSACRNLLQSSPMSAFVLLLRHDLDRELALLDEAHACLPGMPIVAVGDTDHPVLAGLAWELGATFVLFPPTPIETISDVMDRILSSEAP